MVDVVDKTTRSRMMSGIRGRDTKPEITVRHLLHRAGLRFRLNSTLLGKPDIVLPKYRAVVFVHGCFWHRHRNCRYATIPATNAEFWQQKFLDNVRRDRRVIRALRRSKWHVFVIWECEVSADKVRSLVQRITRHAP